jgi:hypothetical protein
MTTVALRSLTLRQLLPDAVSVFCRVLDDAALMARAFAAASPPQRIC